MNMRHLCIALALLSATSSHAATFGDQNAYSGAVIVRDNVAAFLSSPSESGVCDSVTAHLRFAIDSCKVRCALYTVVDEDTVLVANGVTDERRFAAAAYAWQGFAFPDPKPQVTAGVPYFIALFGDSAGSGSGGSPRGGILTGGGTILSRVAEYESGFPPALNPISGITGARLSIYVTIPPSSASASSRRRRCLVGSRPCPAP